MIYDLGISKYIVAQKRHVISSHMTNYVKNTENTNSKDFESLGLLVYDQITKRFCYTKSPMQAESLVAEKYQLYRHRTKKHVLVLKEETNAKNKVPNSFGKRIRFNPNATLSTGEGTVSGILTGQPHNYVNPNEGDLTVEDFD